MELGGWLSARFQSWRWTDPNGGGGAWRGSRSEDADKVKTYGRGG
jgi:hypothetical protein